MKYFNKISLFIIVMVVVVTNINAREWFKNNSPETLAAYFAAGFGVGTVNAKLSKLDPKEFNLKCRLALGATEHSNDGSPLEINQKPLLKTDNFLVKQNLIENPFKITGMEPQKKFYIISTTEKIQLKNINGANVTITEASINWDHTKDKGFILALVNDISRSNNLNNLATGIISAGVIGYNAKERNWWHMLAYAAGLGLRFYLGEKA
jgi:hypothetical protein